MGAGDGDFFREGEWRGLDGEVFDHEVGRPEGSQPVVGAALEYEVTQGDELVFVLGVAAACNEVGEDDDVIGKVVVTVAVFPDFELDVDVAPEVAEGCADAVPVADCIIVAGIISLGDVDAKLPTANLGCIRHSWSLSPWRFAWRRTSALPSLAREVVEEVFDAVSDDSREGFVGAGCCHFFEF